VRSASADKTRALELFAADARRSNPQQIYARQVFGQLRALHRCATLKAEELERHGVDQVHCHTLQSAIAAFDAAVPGAKYRA